MIYMGIFDIHSKAMNTFQNIIRDGKDNIKTCVITFPNDAILKQYQGKSFLLECITSNINNEQIKDNNSVYSNEAVKITLLIDDLESSYDTKNTIKCITRGFKTNNVSVKYNATKYVVKEERFNEFKTSVSLYCEVGV